MRHAPRRGQCLFQRRGGALHGALMKFRIAIPAGLSLVVQQPLRGQITNRRVVLMHGRQHHALRRGVRRLRQHFAPAS